MISTPTCAIFTTWTNPHGARAYLHHADRPQRYAGGNYSKLPLLFLPSNNSVPFYIRYGNGDLQRANGNGWGVFLCNDEFVETQFSTTDKRRTELIHRDIYDASGNPIVPNQVKGYFSSKYVDPDFIGERTSARPYLIRFSDIALVYAEAA